MEKDFLQLDSVIARKDVYIARKVEGIDKYRREHIQPIGDMERCTYYKHLYDEYLKFVADSALHYANLGREMAAKNGWEDWEMISQIDIIYITLLKGEYYTAHNMFRQLRPIEEFPPVMQPKIAVLQMELRMRMPLIASDITSVELSEESYPDTWNKYGKYLPEKGWMHAYYESLLTKNGDKKEIQGHIDRSATPSIQKAMLYFALAKVYSCEGNAEMFMHCLIMSAVNDVMSANREASSMVYIVHSPQLDKASRRAAEYAMLCAENLKAYGDKGRSLDVIKASATITKAYEEKLHNKRQTMAVVIGLLAVSLLLIALMLYLLLKKSRRQTAVNARLREMGESLRIRIESEGRIREELKTSNEQLQRSNELLENEIQQRNRNFIDVYKLASRYIADVQNFKKSLFNLVTAGKLDKVRKELSSASATETYLQEFYAQFDRAFLASHPDFIARLNELLKPECRIAQASALTPELRIFALVSIGIKDSMAIADFLHYSPQTIYNYSLRMRRNACIPEKEFTDTVARMYEEGGK